MTHWLISLALLAAMAAGFGQLGGDRDRDRDQLHLQDGSCETCPCATAAVAIPTQFNA